MGTLGNHFIELIVPWSIFSPAKLRHIAGILLFSFQFTLILSGNLSFLNWLTIVPILACFYDGFWKWILPQWLVKRAEKARTEATEDIAMKRISWAVFAMVGLLSIKPVLNLCSPRQVMNTSFDNLHFVNTYGAFGTVGRDRLVIIFEGTDALDPNTPDWNWKEYTFAALPSDPYKAPIQIAPYQPHLDWQLWFAAMSSASQYPWTLHNDPGILSLSKSRVLKASDRRNIDRTIHMKSGKKSHG